MTCYRDKTYCTGEGCANFRGCPDELTHLDISKAKALGLGISYNASPKDLPCYVTPNNAKQAEANTIKLDGE